MALQVKALATEVGSILGIEVKQVNQLSQLSFDFYLTCHGTDTQKMRKKRRRGEEEEQEEYKARD